MSDERIRWRVWAVVDERGSLRLASPFRGTVWVRNSMVAPHGQGVYAARSREGTLQWAEHAAALGPYLAVIGRVELSGEAPRRRSAGTMVSLVSLDELVDHRGGVNDLAGVLEELRERYGVTP